MAERQQIAVVPHTHWDREWYEPYQVFRFKLVELLDRLLPLMEQDPSYKRFLLDGQMAVVDDYLEVRPENEDRLRALATSGRLTMGPWYILMDEFLVSAETIIRNLQLGIDTGARFGGVAEVGYLPDMFGHIAQMPQILRQAGFRDTVLWRGVPSTITKDAFTWVAPDGSSVRAEYLPVGYGNGANLPKTAEALLQRAQDHLEEIGSFVQGTMLWMNGSDHLMPQEHLGRVLREANELQDDYEFTITSLAEYLRDAPREGLETWVGEMRSGARSNVLMGVTSNRVDVKVAAARAEYLLERRAEPLTALFAPESSWPKELLDLAWLEVIRNSAHDSICACSVDEVVDAVLHRFHEASSIARSIADQTLYNFTASLREPGDYVLNTSQFARGGVAELLVTGDDLDESAMQVLSESMRYPANMEVDGETLKTIVGLLNGPRIADDVWIRSASATDLDDNTIALQISIGPVQAFGVELEELRRDLAARIATNPALRAKIAIDQPRIRRVATTVAEVPGYSWSPLTPVAPSNPVVVEATEVDGRTIWSMSNGLTRLEIDPLDGTFSLNGLPGYNKLVDGGDLGDSYNYSPPATDSFVDRPTSVAVTATERGPIRGVITIAATYDLPTHIDPMRQRRTGSVSTVVSTTITLVADAPSVSVEVTFVNPCRDHRFRIHLPLPTPASASIAECAFGTVTRGLTAEGRPEERGLPTFPSRRFVMAGGLTVAHEGLNEYELIDLDAAGTSARTLALTLVRSTGMLSRLGMTYRPFPAGPLTPVEGLQMVGSTVTARYVLGVGLDPWELSDRAFAPLDVVKAEGGGDRPRSGTAFSVNGAMVSSIRRVAGELEVRVFNPTGSPAMVDLDGAEGFQVNLRGAPESAFSGEVHLDPYRFSTLRISNRDATHFN
jgi:hypothetical protein